MPRYVVALGEIRQAEVEIEVDSAMSIRDAEVYMRDLGLDAVADWDRAHWWVEGVKFMSGGTS